jgi:hypothetical protein
MSDVVVDAPVTATDAAPVAAAAVAVPPEAPPKPADAPVKPKLGDFARRATAERAKVLASQAEKARDERAIRAESERDALKARISEIEERRQGYIQNPIQVLMDAFPGMEPAKAFEIISDAARNNGKAPVQAETYAIKRELEAIKATALAEKEASQAEARKATEARAKETETAFKAEISEFIKENSETYELIALYEQSAAVFEVMDAHFRATFDPATGKGEILTKKQAAGKVESHLEGLGDKMLKAKKIAAKIQSQATPSTKTLTNDLAQGARSTPALTDKERLARAIAAMAAAQGG